MKSLVRRGADVLVTDHKGKTALHRAAQAGFVEVIGYLIAEGAYVEAGDNKGETPLFDAVRKGRLEAVRALCAAGARVGHENRLGQSALVLANRARTVTKADVVEVLEAAESQPGA